MGLARRVPASRLAVVGLGMVAAMGFVFVATGGDRGGLYVVVNALAVVAALVAAWGAARLPSRTGMALLGGGLLGQAAMRLLNVVLDLTRLPLWQSALIFAGWTLAGASAAAWAARPERPRAGGVRTGLFLAGAGYFFAFMATLSADRLSALGALLLGTLGLLLAAPRVEGPPPTSSRGG
jgi:hypothetical protein